MNPQDNREKMWCQLTDEERKAIDEKTKLAVIELEGMEHHIPPRKGEHCYFKSSPRSPNMRSRLARYICVTNCSGSIGVDFSVEKCVDTYYSCYHYQGTLERITVDHGTDECRFKRLL